MTFMEKFYLFHAFLLAFILMVAHAGTVQAKEKARLEKLEKEKLEKEKLEKDKSL